MLSSMRLCSNVPAQSIIATALKDPQSAKSYVTEGGRLIRQREIVMEMIDQIPGLTCVKPKAAFYCFPKIDTKKIPIYDDMKFAYDFLREKHVLIVQGTGFNWPDPDHFRIVFLPEETVLREAMGSLKDFLATYQQTR